MSGVDIVLHWIKIRSFKPHANEKSASIQWKRRKKTISAGCLFRVIHWGEAIPGFANVSPILGSTGNQQPPAYWVLS